MVHGVGGVSVQRGQESAVTAVTRDDEGGPSTRRSPLPRGPAWRGWVYYAPEVLRVQIAASKTHAGQDLVEADDFRQIDPRRFLR